MLLVVVVLAGVAVVAGLYARVRTAVLSKTPEGEMAMQTPKAVVDIVLSLAVGVFIFALSFFLI